MRTRHLPLLLVAAWIAGCGDATGNDPGPVPTDQNPVCLGYSHGIQFDLVCPAGAGGDDHFCNFVISTSDPNILQILDMNMNVADNTSASTGFLGTLGVNPGVVQILVRETASGIQTSPGSVTVTNQPCVF